MENQTLDALTYEMVSLRWDKKFDQALQLYKERIFPSFSKNEIVTKPALIGAVCDCLRETGQPAKAISFVCDYLELTVDNLQTLADNKLIINLGWLFVSVFQNIQKKLIESISTKQLDFSVILAGLLQKRGEHKLFEILFFKITDYYLSFNNINWLKLQELTTKVNGHTFSSYEKVITLKVKGKEKEENLASANEKWLILRIRILFHLSDFIQCSELCLITLDGGLEKFHHGNQVWIARYLAKCYQQLGKLTESIHYFEKITHQKKDWFLLKELSDCYLAAGRKEEAFQTLLKAFLQQGHSSYKVSLYEALGRFAENDKTIAEAGICLSVLVRKENGWKFSMLLERSCAAQFPDNAAKVYELIALQAQKLLKLPQKDLLYENGIISRILHEGNNGDGFITSISGKTIYFRMSQCSLSTDEAIIGAEVECKAKRSLIGINERWQAIQVILVKKRM